MSNTAPVSESKGLHLFVWQHYEYGMSYVVGLLSPDGKELQYPVVVTLMNDGSSGNSSLEFIVNSMDNLALVQPSIPITPNMDVHSLEHSGYVQRAKDMIRDVYDRTIQKEAQYIAKMNPDNLNAANLILNVIKSH